MVGGSALFQVAMKIARNIFQGDRWHSGTIMVPLWLSIGSRLPELSTAHSPVPVVIVFGGGQGGQRGQRTENRGCRGCRG